MTPPHAGADGRNDGDARLAAPGGRAGARVQPVHFVAPAAYPLGGVATWLDRMVADLPALGWTPRVVLAAGDHHDATRYEAAHPAVAPALHVRAGTSTRQGRVRALVQALGAGSGLVVSANIPDALVAAARLKARRGGATVRAVMSIHGLEPDLFADVARFAPLLDGVICTNRLAQVRARLCADLEPARVLYAPYGTDEPPARPAPPARDRTLTIGFAGRFERFQKRVQDLAPIAQALRQRGVDARWLVAGDGPDAADVQALVSAGAGAVELLGRVAPAQMHERFHARCDVLLNPSAWETGPIVVWEAMAHGVTVVSSRYVGSGREAALEHERNCLLFSAGDVDAAAQCLARAADPVLRRRLADAGRELVARRYSPRASADAWSRALASIAARPARHGPVPDMAPAGRLDRWLGPALGEWARRAARRRAAHAAPGDEWPHTYAAMPRDEASHWALLRDLDLDHGREPPPREARLP